jgi:hypothetical protein
MLVMRADMEAGVRGSLGGLRHDPFSSLPMRLPHRDLAAGDHFGFFRADCLSLQGGRFDDLGFLRLLGLANLAATLVLY